MEYGSSDWDLDNGDFGPMMSGETYSPDAPAAIPGGLITLEKFCFESSAEQRHAIQSRLSGPDRVELQTALRDMSETDKARFEAVKAAESAARIARMNAEFAAAKS